MITSLLLLKPQGCRWWKQCRWWACRCMESRPELETVNK